MRSRTILATPPGYTIKEQLEQRGMTQKEFAVRMDMSEKHISQLINGEVRLTPNTAMRLEAILGLSASFWNNLEVCYQEKKLRAEEENAMDADIELLKEMPYAEMVSLGWIEKATRAADKVKKLRKYFEVARLVIIDNLKTPAIAYHRLTSKEAKDYVLAVWVQKAKLEARAIKVLPINLQELSLRLSEIRELTTKAPEEFYPKLTKILSDCGIALVCLPHMKGSYLHGASFLDGKKIVMALTVRGRDADKFWFSLFHEVGHILNGDINKPDGPAEEDEQLADKFAGDFLIPPDDYKRFVMEKDFTFSSVKKFATDEGIDAGIVVGRLQKEGEMNFNQLNSLKKQYQII